MFIYGTISAEGSLQGKITAAGTLQGVLSASKQLIGTVQPYIPEAGRDYADVSDILAIFEGGNE